MSSDTPEHVGAFHERLARNLREQKPVLDLMQANDAKDTPEHVGGVPVGRHPWKHLNAEGGICDWGYSDRLHPLDELGRWHALSAEACATREDALTLAIASVMVDDDSDPRDAARAAQRVLGLGEAS